MYERNLNDKLDQQGKFQSLPIIDDNRMERALLNRIEYDMSESKKQLRMKLEDKIEMELMRRWRVKLYNIYITPLKEKIDPFLQFTIGGDFSVQVFTTKNGKPFKVPKGERGLAEKTEVLQNVAELTKVPFDKIIDTEMRMSYSMINNQKLMVELWDYNTFFMNNIKGYHTRPLIDIVNGDVNVEIDICKHEPGRKNPRNYCLI